MRPKHEVAEVIEKFNGSYEKLHKPTPYICKTFNALLKCRTASLGGHTDVCENCRHTRNSYNSCRNRHCPKCQATNRERWIEYHSEKLLPVKHFHVVFTLPHELNGYCIRYAKEMYGLLFQTVWKTIEGFAINKNHLGALSGMISILHTWGQQLMLHPHVHCIIPAGGINEQGLWQSTRGNGTYLFPIGELRKVFRAKYVAGIRRLVKQGLINDPGRKFLDDLFKKDWVVYAKKPFNNSKGVMEYIGRYSHKIAISNHRLISVDDKEVTFSYKDYRDDGKNKAMTLSGEEFLRRYALHVLPRSFVKIRHFGIFSSRNVEMLHAVKCKMLGQPPAPREKKPKKSWKVICREKLNFNPDLCPCCKKGRMIRIEVLKPVVRPPPVLQLNNDWSALNLANFLILSGVEG